MVVEIIGIPGSGKTTFYKKICKENRNVKTPLELYKAEFIKQHKKAKALLKPLLCFINRGRSTFLDLISKKHLLDIILLKSNKHEAYKLILENNCFGNVKKKEMLINNLIEYTIFEHQFGPILLDEGFIQHYANCSKVLQSNDLRIFDYLPVPKVIFFLELDISQALIRMKNRDKGIPRSLSELNTDQLKTHLEIFKVNLELISQKCKALGTKVYNLNKEYNFKKVNEIIDGMSEKDN